MRRITWIVAGLLAALLSTAVRAQETKPLAVIKDCSDCPAMVVVPSGSFMMGAAAGEVVGATIGSGAIEQGATQILQPTSTAKPQHKVTIAKSFALGQREVTYAEYAQFVKEANYQSDGKDCLLVDVGSDDNIFQQDKYAAAQGVRNTSWRVPPSWYTGPNYPVTCVSWSDARAYAEWLSKKTKHKYRLPSEAEWEYAARAGSTGFWYWGNDPKQACQYENVADLTFLKRRMRSATSDNHFDCDDKNGFNVAVGSFKPNPWGLYDMVGNVSEFTEDCWHADYQGAPTNGAAWTNGGDCRFKVLRGDNGMFNVSSSHLAARSGVPVGQYRAQIAGFRLVREL